MSIYNIFLQIQNTSGTLAKKKILSDNLNDIIRWIFLDTYGSQKYYIKTLERTDVVGARTLDNDYYDFHKALERLSNREITGNDAYDYIQEIISKYDADSQDILYKIMDRNLKIGISMDNYLDIVGGTKFEVALAENVSKAKGVNLIDGTYWISRKLDGVRTICFIRKENNRTSVQFKSRQGKPFNTLSNLYEPIIKFTEPLRDGEYVLDGETCIVDDNGMENFHGLMKEVTRKNHTIEKPKYKMFDILTLDEFNGLVESERFYLRYLKLSKLNAQYTHPFIEVLHQELVTSQEILDKYIEMARSNGWEGCMLRKDAPYKRGRSKDLLKIKEFVTNDYYIKKIITGKVSYNENGMKEYDAVSSLVIEHRGNEVFVGSGLSKEQRLRWYEHPEEIIGTCVRIKYFEETKDSKTGLYSLRFPVLDYIYGKERFDSISDQYIE